MATGPLPKALALVPARRRPLSIAVLPVYVLFPVRLQALLPCLTRKVGPPGPLEMTELSVWALLASGFGSVPVRVKVGLPAVSGLMTTVPLRVRLAETGGEASRIAPLVVMVKPRLTETPAPAAHWS